MSEFTVMMIGPEAVGKTTLLATMYKELNKMKSYARFNFYAENDTGINLDSAYQKLSRIIEQPTFTSIKPLLEGTRGIIYHRFEIAFKDKKELDLVFCDIAGGLINVSANDQDFRTFQQLLNRASVIVNVIDGAVLMEGSDIFFDRINKPSRIRDLLRPALNDEQSHLILFVISKCEAWLNKAEGRARLEKKFDERFKEVINLIEDRRNAVGVVIPVKTLGCVEFSRMEKEGDEEKAVFVRRANKKFEPEFTDQPLRYALSFVLTERDKNRRWWEKFFRAWDPSFKESLHQFVTERDATFKTYGNFQLTRIC